jgi:hypothetical protein
MTPIALGVSIRGAAECRMTYTEIKSLTFVIEEDTTVTHLGI